jgi:hypothetical protein
MLPQGLNAVARARRLVLIPLLLALALAALSTASASAAPCQTCEDAPPPPPPTGPPAPPTPWHEVFIDGFYQYDAEDGITDEIYLELNGERVWGPNPMSLEAMHGWKQVSVKRYVLGNSFDFEMWDEDWPDPDDALGRFRIGIPSLKKNETVKKEVWATNFGAKYRIELSIRRTA